jgi:hypothetical protein
VFSDAPQAGTDSDYEWAEVYNPTAAAVDLAGWKLRDNTTEDAIPRFVLAPGEYLIVAATASGFAANNPGFTGYLVSLEGSIGGGLGNTGDRVLLLAPDGTTVDAMSYGSDSGGFDPSCPNAPVGGSLARTLSAQDTDTAADWIVQQTPNPGAGVNAPAPTATRTPTPTSTVTPLWSPTPSATGLPTQTPTPSPTSTGATLHAIRLNEFLPYPDQIDWNGDGKVDSGDEWIEIVSLEPAAIDLGGWMLDDIAGAGSKPYTFSAGTLLLPGSFLFRFGSTTGVILNNDGDTVRLLAPDGTEVDGTTYLSAHADRSFSRSVDGVGNWTEAYPASPGQPNRPATPTPTPTLTLTRPPTATPTATSTGTPTRASTATPTGTPTSTATPFAQGVVLNEFLPEPSAIDWNGDGQARFDDEWIELYNLGATPVSIGGWAVADATQAYTLPLGTMIWQRGYLLLHRAQTHRTLGDTRGSVSLLRPDGSVADSFAYTQGRIRAIAGAAMGTALGCAAASRHRARPIGACRLPPRRNHRLTRTKILTLSRGARHRLRRGLASRPHARLVRGRWRPSRAA